VHLSAGRGATSGADIGAGGDKRPDTRPAANFAGLWKVKFTGLTQNSQVDPEVWLKIPMKALES
jgi:hypothetical protein